jgi:hypothetical protein
MLKRSLVVIIMAAAITLGTTGCTYMENRGDDLSEVIDVGVTTSAKPQFSTYCGFFNLVSLGYSNFEGCIHGLVGGEAGTQLATHDTWGLLIYGKEELAYAPAPDDVAPQTEPWGVGLGLAEYGAPPNSQIANCPKLLHLGWVGLTLNCKFGELADFLVGFTTVDIMDDDV